MRRRALCVLAVLAAACSFPGVTYSNGSGSDGSAGDDGGQPEASAAEGSTEASTEGGMQGDDGSVDGSGLVDVVDEYVFEAAPDAPVCDQDEDTYQASSTQCSGNDCCDKDSHAHPNETGYFTAPDNCGSFDYDCDGTLEPEYPVNITCGGTGLTGCTGGSGFTGAPQCGESGPYGTCMGSGALKCTVQGITMVVQACR